MNVGTLTGFLKLDRSNWSQGMTESIRQTQELNQNLGRMEQSSQKASSGLWNMVNAAKAFAVAIVGMKLTQHARKAHELAARYETLGVSMYKVGENAGYSSKQMDEQEKQLRRTGITMLESRQNLTRLVQANIDLAHASDIARIAQDAAVIANTNSSEAYTRLIYGIQTGNTRILRNIGIIVNFRKAYQDMADQVGVNVSMLNEEQKAQARVNAVKEKGKDIAGTYLAAMDTVGKKLGSLARPIEDTYVNLGRMFLPLTGKVVDDLTLFFQRTVKWLEENKDKVDEWGQSILRAAEALYQLGKIIAIGAALQVGLKALGASVAVLIGGFNALIVAIAAVKKAYLLLQLEMAIISGITKAHGAWYAFKLMLKSTGVAIVSLQGKMLLLARTVNLVFAFWVGWKIGEYLRNEFEIIERASIKMVDVVMRGWLYFQHGVIVIWEYISLFIKKSINDWKDSFAWWIEKAVKGLDKLGFKRKAEGLEEYLGELREGIALTETYAQLQARLTQEYKDKETRHNFVIKLWLEDSEGERGGIEKFDNELVAAIALMNKEFEELEEAVIEFAARRNAAAKQLQEEWAKVAKNINDELRVIDKSGLDRELEQIAIRMEDLRAKFGDHPLIAEYEAALIRTATASHELAVATKAASEAIARQNMLLDDAVNSANVAEDAMDALTKATMSREALAEDEVRKQYERLNGMARQLAMIGTITEDVADQFQASFAVRMAEDLDKLGEKTKSLAEEMKDAFNGWASSFSSTLNDALWDAEFTFSKIAESFGKMITQMIIQKQIVEPMFAAVTGGNFFSSLFGGVTKSAKGNVFDNISGHSNSIVTSPTAFAYSGLQQFASGGGLMGEAGPEAVMPLRRGPDGRLGVLNYSSSPTDIKIELVNKSGHQMKAAQPTVSFDMKRMVIGVVLEGIEDNTLGLRRALGGS